MKELVVVDFSEERSYLQHVVQLSDATLMVCHADLAPPFQNV